MIVSKEHLTSAFARLATRFATPRPRQNFVVARGAKLRFLPGAKLRCCPGGGKLRCCRGGGREISATAAGFRVNEVH